MFEHNTKVYTAHTARVGTCMLQMNLHEAINYNCVRTLRCILILSHVRACSIYISVLIISELRYMRKKSMKTSVELSL